MRCTKRGTRECGSWDIPLTEPAGISTLPEFSILSLAVRRKGIARYAVLHLDCARSAKGRSLSVAFEELSLVPK